MRPQFDSWVGKIPWRIDKLSIPVFLGFPDDLDGKESACNAGDVGSMRGLGRSLGGGHGNHTLQSFIKNYPCILKSLPHQIVSPWSHDYLLTISST